MQRPRFKTGGRNLVGPHFTDDDEGGIEFEMCDYFMMRQGAACSLNTGTRRPIGQRKVVNLISSLLRSCVLDGECAWLLKNNNYLNKK